MTTPARPLHVLTSSIALVAAGVVVASAVALGATPSSAPGDASGAACPTNVPGALGAVDHPTEPDTIVLRMFVGGGFVPMDVAFMENPTFTLYGSNVAIFRSAGEQQSMLDPMAPFACQPLTSTEVDALLTFALTDGGLRDAADLYPDPFIVDTPNTTFTINAAGIDKTVTIQALGFNDEAPDQAARAQFGALADRLDGFAANLESPELYDVREYRAMLGSALPEPQASAVPWPWPGISVDGLGAGSDPLVLTLTSDEVAAVASVPNGGQAYVLLEADTGDIVSLTISPILPGAALE